MVWRTRTAQPNSVPNELTGIDRDYFLAHGTYPPTVGEDETSLTLADRMSRMRKLASEGHDPEMAMQISREIGYLAYRAIELKAAEDATEREEVHGR